MMITYTASMIVLAQHFFNMAEGRSFFFSILLFFLEPLLSIALVNHQFIIIIDIDNNKEEAPL